MHSHHRMQQMQLQHTTEHMKQQEMQQKQQQQDRQEMKRSEKRVCVHAMTHELTRKSRHNHFANSQQDSPQPDMPHLRHVHQTQQSDLDEERKQKERGVHSYPEQHASVVDPHHDEVEVPSISAGEEREGHRKGPFHQLHIHENTFQQRKTCLEHHEKQNDLRHDHEQTESGARQLDQKRLEIAGTRSRGLGPTTAEVHPDQKAHQPQTAVQDRSRKKLPTRRLPKRHHYPQGVGGNS